MPKIESAVSAPLNLDFFSISILDYFSQLLQESSNNFSPKWENALVRVKPSTRSSRRNPEHGGKRAREQGSCSRPFLWAGKERQMADTAELACFRQGLCEEPWVDLEYELSSPWIGSQNYLLLGNLKIVLFKNFQEVLPNVQSKFLLFQ